MSCDDAYTDDDEKFMDGPDGSSCFLIRDVPDRYYDFKMFRKLNEKFERSRSCSHFGWESTAFCKFAMRLFSC